MHTVESTTVGPAAQVQGHGWQELSEQPDPPGPPSWSWLDTHHEAAVRGHQVLGPRPERTSGAAALLSSIYRALSSSPPGTLCGTRYASEGLTHRTKTLKCSGVRLPRRLERLEREGEVTQEPKDTQRKPRLSVQRESARVFETGPAGPGRQHSGSGSCGLNATLPGREKL